MVRAAAKNHDFVTIVTDPADYTAVVAEMTEQQNAIGATLRRRLAMQAFGHTAAYDAMIADWLAREQGARFPDPPVPAGRTGQALRCGEHPPQPAAAHARANARPPVPGAAPHPGPPHSTT